MGSSGIVGGPTVEGVRAREAWKEVMEAGSWES